MVIIVFILILVAMFLVENFYYRRNALKDLNLKVDFSKKIANHGEDIEIIEVAENRKRLPLPFIILKFAVPLDIKFYDMEHTSTSDHQYREDMLTMKAFSKHTRRIKAKCTKRGYYTFPSVSLTTSDIFLTSRFANIIPCDSDLVVLPSVINEPVIPMLMSVTISEIQRRRTMLTDPFTLSNIREYMPGDPMKSINWKASARTGDLMVNQNASTCTQKVHIFVNLESYSSKRSTELPEKCISLAYTYLQELADRGISSSVYTNGKDCITGTPAVSDITAGPEAFENRAVMLARIDLSKAVIPFGEMLGKYISSTDHDDFILVISSHSNKAFQYMFAEHLNKRPYMKWLMPCYRDMSETDVIPEIASSLIRWEVRGND